MKPVKTVVHAPGDEYGLLTIGANLMPAELAQAWRGRLARRRVLTMLVLFAVVLGAWYTAVRIETGQAEAKLAATSDQTIALQRQQQKYADLNRIKAESQAISKQLATLLANDASWSRLITSLQGAAPAGVRVESVSGSLDPPSSPPAKAQPSAAAKPHSAPNKVIGTLTLTGSGSDNAAIAEYVDTLGNVPGLANPMLSSVTLISGSLQFKVSLDVTSAALSGRYTGDGTGQGS